MKRFFSGIPVSAIFAVALVFAFTFFLAYGVAEMRLLPESTPMPTVTPAITPAATYTVTPTPSVTPSPVPVAWPTSAPTATPTRVPSPIATAAPAASDTPTPTLAPAGTSGQRALQHVRYLSESIGSRPAGSPQERSAADYISGQFQSYGYTVQRQSFSFPYFIDRGATLVGLSPQDNSLHPLTMGLSAGGTVEGPVASVGLGRPEDMPREGLKGRVALIQRGNISFDQKIAAVTKAGATAAIIYNNAQGNFRGRLASLASIPVVSISQDEGTRILQTVSHGSATVRVSVNATSETRQGQNVIATKPGGRPDMVVFGAHYDSVEAGPGANDNASGVATLLELARLARSGPLTQRFIAFSAEELGLYGSQYYVSTLNQQGRQQIKAMLSLDMVGVGDRMRVGGDSQLVAMGLAIAGEDGIPALALEGVASGGSDHSSFISAGIPAAIFSYTVGNDMDPRYHTASDKASFVDPADMEKTVQVCQTLVTRLAEGR